MIWQVCFQTRGDAASLGSQGTAVFESFVSDFGLGCMWEEDASLANYGRTLVILNLL